MESEAMKPEYLQNKWVCRYFKPHETICKCGCGKQIVVPLQRIIDNLRQYTYSKTGKVMIINSGARCVADNIRVKGSKKSQHLRGYAVDIRCISQRYRLELMKAVGAVGHHIDDDKREWEINFIKACPTYVHIDIRENNSGFLWECNLQSGKLVKKFEH